MLIRNQRHKQFSVIEVLSVCHLDKRGEQCITKASVSLKGVSLFGPSSKTECNLSTTQAPPSEKRRSKKEKKTVYRVEMETESEEIIGKAALNRLESHRYYIIIATPGHSYSPSPSALPH